MFEWFKTKTCKHEFKLKDLKKTGIPPLEEPETKGYDEWIEYYSKVDDHDSVTKRVEWKCHKCEKVFYAHCGLDITPTHGYVV